jgi:hypothetical protein
VHACLESDNDSMNVMFVHNVAIVYYAFLLLLQFIISIADIFVEHLCSSYEPMTYIHSMNQVALLFHIALA